MIFEIFQNGSDKVNKRLLIIELACNTYIVLAGGLEGSLALMASTDWWKMIPHHEIIAGLFGAALGLSVVVIKAVEMFFSKAAQLYKQSKDDLSAQQTPNQETKI